MATENPVLVDTIVAGADLTTAQYKIVTAAGVLAGAGAGGFVLQDAPASGQDATIMLLGLTKLLIGGTVTAGAKIASNASGVGLVATTGQTVVATALTGGVTGDIIEAIVPGQALA